VARALKTVDPREYWNSSWNMFRVAPVFQISLFDRL